MNSFLKNLIEKTKEAAQSASEDIKVVIDAVSEDAGKLAGEARIKLSEAEKYVSQEFGEPEALVSKAKESINTAGQKLKEAALEEWESTSEKIEELKKSWNKPGKTGEESDIAPEDNKSSGG